MNNPEFRSPALCALSCYAATYSLSTVPYYSLDMPRNVTLVYNGDHAVPRPFIYADVDGGSAAGGVAATRYTMSATVNGAAVTFLNGQTLLTFTGSQPAAPVRLGGQFDGRAYATDVYPLVVTVRATYADGVTGETSASNHLMIVNESGSRIAKGWTIAGHQRLRMTVSPGYMITNGDGSATRFSGFGVIAADFTTLAYDAPSATYTRRYPDGARATFGSGGQQLSFIEQTGETTNFRYRADGSLKYIDDPYRKQPSGAFTSIGISFDANGIRQIHEPSADGTEWAGRATWLTVDANRCLVSAEDPDGQYTTFTCDTDGRLSTIKDRRQAVTTLVYNATSWKLSQVKLPTVPVNAGNGTTTNKVPIINYTPWHTKGVPTSVTSSTSPWTAPRVSGIVGTVVDPAGRLTILKANRFGQPIDLTEPHGRRTIVNSSVGILPKKITHPNGAIDTMAYDAYGRVTKSHPAGQYLTTFHYNSTGLLDSVAGPGARFQARTYDANNRLERISYGGSPAQTLAFSYLSNTGRVSSITDISGHTTEYVYDPRSGNQAQVWRAGSPTVEKIFDGVGRDSVTTMPTLAPRTALYDLMNRLRSTSANGSTTTLDYNEILQTDLDDANGNHYHTDFNALGWPTNTCDPANLCTTTRYDASGAVLSVTNRRNQRMTVTRDSLARITSLSGPGIATNSYSYSSTGRAMVAWNAIQRDSLFLNPGTQSQAASDSVVTWIDGKRFRISNRAPRAVADTAVTTIASNTGVTFHPRTTNYSPTGSISGVQIGPEWTAFVSSEGGFSFVSYPITGASTRETQILTTHATGRINYYPQSLDASFRRSYHYDQLGRLDLVMIGNPENHQLAFEYDAVGRLKTSSVYTDCFTAPVTDSISGTEHECATQISSDAFTYDALGNRTDRGGVPTTGNRYVTFNGATYSYDADGNLTQKNKAGAYNRQFFWNATGQLDSAKKDGVSSNSYDYSALGKPVRVWDGSSTSRQISRYLLWNGEELTAEFWPNGQRDIDYVYLPGTIDHPFASTGGATTPTEIRYQETDALHNVMGTHRNGTVTQSTQYDPWGIVTSSNADSHLLWKGLFWNGDVTGLHYMRNRWYDPEGGRFVSEDPSGLEGGINLYTFGGNDPVNSVDPSGLCTAAALDAAVEAARAGEPYSVNCPTLGTVYITGDRGIDHTWAGPSLGLPPMGFGGLGSGGVRGSGPVGKVNWPTRECAIAVGSFVVSGVADGAFYVSLFTGVGMAVIAARQAAYSTTFLRGSAASLLFATQGMVWRNTGISKASVGTTDWYSIDTLNSLALQGSNISWHDFIPGAATYKNYRTMGKKC